MGLNINGVKLLLRAKARGVNFEQTLMIGRQRLRITEQALGGLLEQYDYQPDLARQLINSQNGYAEPLLKLLGARHIDALDGSGYEKANLIHDMNRPIPEQWKQSYSLVLDGGSLEHIFNFPQAMQNCMEMLQLGGVFLGISPANNFFGHGFYQFSPELYFRVFSAENGFSVQEVLFFTDRKHRMKHELSTLYSVTDPLEAGQRVELSNAEPSYLFIQAKREEVKGIFGQWPQQSDYEHLKWKKKNSNKSSHATGLTKTIQRWSPDILRNARRKLILLMNPTGNARRDFFNRID